MTDSIRYAVDETNRRRSIQIAYNKEHGITPKTIERNIADIVQTMNAPQPAVPAREDLEEISPTEALSKIRQLEKEMRQAADRLEFEEAAALRDEIRSLRKKL